MRAPVLSGFRALGLSVFRSLGLSALALSCEHPRATWFLVFGGRGLIGAVIVLLRTSQSEERRVSCNFVGAELLYCL